MSESLAGVAVAGVMGINQCSAEFERAGWVTVDPCRPGEIKSSR